MENNILVIGIAGGTASGKTTLMKNLIQEFGGEVTVLSHDNYYKRHDEMPEGSYTTSLFKDGLNRMAQKVGEEALEAVIEATNGTDERLIYEASDMFYHLIVLLTSKGLRIEDIAKELQVRHRPNWHKH